MMAANFQVVTKVVTAAECLIQTLQLVETLAETTAVVTFFRNLPAMMLVMR